MGLNVNDAPTPRPAPAAATGSQGWAWGPCSGDGGMYPPMLKKKALLPRGPWDPVQARDGENHCLEGK